MLFQLRKKKKPQKTQPCILQLNLQKQQSDIYVQKLLRKVIICSIVLFFFLPTIGPLFSTP